MRIFLFLLASFLLSSCVNDQQQQSADALIIDRDAVVYGKDVVVTLQTVDAVDSIRIVLNGQPLLLEKESKTITLKASDLKLGNNTLSTALFRKEQMSAIIDSVQVYPAYPKQYTFKKISEIDHDTLAYTQGLEFYDGDLYESTGAADDFISSVRKVNWKTGKVIQRKEYPGNDPSGEPYFMEGLTFADAKLVLLTYLNGHGFILDPVTFNEKATFHYGKSRQGWGICFDGQKLIKSDGTSYLHFLDTETYEEIGTLAVYDNNGLIDQFVLNELEYVGGKLYANYYGKDEILIIDPTSGIVEGVVNCIGLHRSVAEPKKEMNGIAYNPSTKNFYVTGKQWDKLYEIALVER